MRIWRVVVVASVSYRASRLPNDWMSSHAEQDYREAARPGQARQREQRRQQQGRRTGGETVQQPGGHTIPFRTCVVVRVSATTRRLLALLKQQRGGTLDDG